MTELNNFINRFQFTLPTTRQPVFKAGKSAAVLLPIINKPHPTLLLTQRSPFLRSHAGEVAFPGGQVTPRMAHPSTPPYVKLTKKWRSLRKKLKYLANSPHSKVMVATRSPL